MQRDTGVCRSPHVLDLFKNHRRAHLRDQPLTEAELAVIAKNVPYVATLDETEREELGGLVRIFLAEQHFEGCGGLELTDEIKITIAANACILLLHRQTDVYPNVESILVYPSAYRAPDARNQDGVIAPTPARLGESWVRGVVVLAWDHVTSGVVLHEFAHQLDSENGSMDGAPELRSRANYATWAHVLGDEFAELTTQLHHGHRSDIDAYGATNPAEFFAVVTEMFFEKGHAMKAKHPALYEQLAAFYQQDPATRGTAQR